MIENILNETKQKMEQSIIALEKNLATIRTGRANPSMLDGINPEYYGVETPLNQLAVISVPEARQLLIKPFDKSALGEIERAINKSNLGLTPNNDGETIRIVIPDLTKERRMEFQKQAKAKAEEAKVSLRNVRHEAITKIKNLEDSDDAKKRYNDQIQDTIDIYNKKVEEELKNKEKQILEV